VQSKSISIPFVATGHKWDFKHVKNLCGQGKIYICLQSYLTEQEGGLSSNTEHSEYDCHSVSNGGSTNISTKGMLLFQSLLSANVYIVFICYCNCRELFLARVIYFNVRHHFLFAVTSPDYPKALAIPQNQMDTEHLSPQSKQNTRQSTYPSHAIPSVSPSCSLSCLNQLTQMFPTHDKAYLEEVLTASATIHDAMQ